MISHMTYKSTSGYPCFRHFRHAAEPRDKAEPLVELFLDHLGGVLVVGGVLLAGVDAHLQHLGPHVLVHVGLVTFERGSTAFSRFSPIQGVWQNVTTDKNVPDTRLIRSGFRAHNLLSLFIFG